MTTKLQIIGIGGSNGAGKDSIGQILADHYGYLFISVTDLLRAEATKRREPVEREVLRSISAQWRRESGLGVLVEKAVAEYDLAKDKYVGVVMASLRNPGEADKIHDLGGIMVWIDADPRVRYDRIQANAATRNRIEEDNKTFEQFLAEEEAEMHTSGDAATLDMTAVRDRCDLFITNDSSDLLELRAEIEKTLDLSK
jgi:dephospho-CoA kinase